MTHSVSLPSLKGKRFIVTGGARGIGAAAARILAVQGARLAIFDIKDELGASIAERLATEFQTHVIYLHVDVSCRTSVTEGVLAATKSLDGFDGLFHAAGIERQSPPEEMLAEADLDAILNVNIKGTVLMNQDVFPYLKDGGGGVILNVGSDEGLDPCPWLAHYAASKGAVHSYVRAIAKGWGQFNIRVNAILPAVWTEMFDEYREQLSVAELEVVDQRIADRIVLGGRLGDPNEHLAPVISFLMSDCACFITGQLFPVNGGQVQVR
jgi:2-hydroxycyclohexanecarboxyl-CoA dehydrogenase